MENAERTAIDMIRRYRTREASSKPTLMSRPSPTKSEVSGAPCWPSFVRMASPKRLNKSPRRKPRSGAAFSGIATGGLKSKMRNYRHFRLRMSHVGVVTAPCSSLDQRLAASAKCGGMRKRRCGGCDLIVLMKGFYKKAAE
jgi:hypothetical protein